MKTSCRSDVIITRTPRNDDITSLKLTTGERRRDAIKGKAKAKLNAQTKNYLCSPVIHR
ncbi:hypothetical protein M5D96_011783 [Drosophila gunungcola]|uniref:Uncharacterized protein n=1 Tax=Drosophila gunungcola TaxID=103775 RepID=A0A9P9YEG9_9MUSC|nr:hypothetical protein M5D96_011783 [Drosophila gunungcola]